MADFDDREGAATGIRRIEAGPAAHAAATRRDAHQGRGSGVAGPRHGHPADALYEIRAAIKALRAEEAALKAQLARAGIDGRQGRHWRVEIAVQRDRVFDPRRLPPAIRGDPTFWRDRETRRVVLRPISPAPPATGDPGPSAGTDAADGARRRLREASETLVEFCDED